MWKATCSDLKHIIKDCLAIHIVNIQWTSPDIKKIAIDTEAILFYTLLFGVLKLATSVYFSVAILTHATHMLTLALLINLPIFQDVESIRRKNKSNQYKVEKLIRVGEKYKSILFDIWKSFDYSIRIESRNFQFDATLPHSPHLYERRSTVYFESWSCHKLISISLYVAVVNFAKNQQKHYVYASLSKKNRHCSRLKIIKKCIAAVTCWVR